MAEPRSFHFTLGICSLLIIAGCSTSHYERKYLRRVDEVPLTFQVPQSSADSAWQRAKYFVATYTSRKIEQMDDSSIVCERPSFFDLLLTSNYGYFVSRSSDGTSTRFTVDCFSGTPPLWSQSRHNAHILADYIRTGNLPYPNLIAKR